MRAFVIADASRRKASPVALLLWEPDDTRPQGRFALELASAPGEDELPLCLSFCARRKNRRATPDESEAWVRSRIVPEDRHNIAEVLQANGLAHYDAVSLLAASMGRSSDDDYLAFEVRLPDKLAETLSQEAASGTPSRADRFLGALQRTQTRSQVTYAIAEMPECLEGEADASPWHEQPKANAAKRIAGQIKERRKAAGLTQKQLAARAGISQTVLSRIESGAGNPTLALLEAVASALGEDLIVSLGKGEDDAH